MGQTRSGKEELLSNPTEEEQTSYEMGFYEELEAIEEEKSGTPQEG